MNGGILFEILSEYVDDIVRIRRYKRFETAKFLLLHQDSNRDEGEEEESLEI